MTCQVYECSNRAFHALGWLLSRVPVQWYCEDHWLQALGRLARLATADAKKAVLVEVTQ